MREITSAIKQMREIRGFQKRNTARELAEVNEKMIVVQDRLEKHNEIEETEVYEWADLLLPMAERSALNEKLKKEFTNLPPRFKKDHGSSLE